MNGPAILELITFRWYGHVDWREDIDVGVKRSKKDIRKLEKEIQLRDYHNLINSKIWSLKKEN